MATGVRPLGYYTSWFHVVADIPSTSSGINLYTWLGDWTAANYGHRWTNASKKLNAILTIESGTIIQAPFYSGANSLSEDITISSITPAILIPTGANGFRSFDRITITNKGKIIGSYANRQYGYEKARSAYYFSGVGSFTPPGEISQHNIISRHKVDNIDDLEAVAAGGNGGAQIASPVGAGGGGGGAGGRSARSNVSVSPNVRITASGGGVGVNATYKQGATTLASASHGANGGIGAVRSQRYCKSYVRVPPFGRICFKFDAAHTSLRGGSGGAGGRNNMTGVKNGKDGENGGTQGQIYDSSGCEDALAFGGAGGVGAGGNGGKGGEARTKCGVNTNPIGGSAGWLRYSFTQRQLFGMAIDNRHTNIRIINQGQIAGGYNDGQTIYTVYGASLFENPTWGTIYPATPGITNTVLTF